MLLPTHKYHAFTPYLNGHLSSTLARKLAQPIHCATLQGCQRWEWRGQTLSEPCWASGVVVACGGTLDG